MNRQAFCPQGYGTRAQGICPFDIPGAPCRECEESIATFGSDPDKAWIKVPSCRMFAIDRTEIKAVLDKYRELGIRETEETILEKVSRKLQEYALESQADSLTDEQVFAFWGAYKRSVFQHTPEEIIDLLGFDPRR